MSTNYDLIATVSVDIKSSIVDAASFDNILIVGPLPKNEPTKTPSKVGVYTDLEKVTAAGWSIKAGESDPVGIAAQIAFSQKPVPSSVYIAPIQLIESGEKAGEPESVVDTVKRAIDTAGWYTVCPVGVDATEFEALAAYIETQEKLCCYTELDFFDNNDKASVDEKYFRTFGIFGKEYANQEDNEIPEANKYLNVAFAAKWLGYQSGTETAAYKTLASVTPSKLSKEEMEKLATAKLNYFVTVGGKNISMGGTVMAGEWADIVRFRDWLKNDMQVRVVDLLIANTKIPFTDNGIALIENQMRASLKAGQDLGAIAEDEFDEDNNSLPGYTTTVPAALSIPPTDKSKRKLSGLGFKARLSGAIHIADLNGTLAYEA